MAILKWPISLANSVESATSEYIMYIKIRGIGNWIPESATGPLLIRKISENDKIALLAV